MMKIDVSVIIVNYNTKQLLKDCLASIYEHTSGIDFEVIVSDNGSKDGSIEMLKADFPQVILIENNANLGFGAANNRGLAIAKGKYIFYLNSDTILLNNAVKCFFDYFEENGEKENIGVLGANLLTPQNTIAKSYGTFYSDAHRVKVAIVDFLRVCKASLPFVNKWHSKKQSAHKEVVTEYIGSVDFIIGADMFLLNDKNARFDEDFFMYVEEVNLQRAMQRLHKERRLILGPKIIHLEGASSAKEKPKTTVEFYTSFSKLNQMVSTILYVKKNGGSRILLFLLRFFTYLTMTHPLIRKKAKPYLKKILK